VRRQARRVRIQTVVAAVVLTELGGDPAYAVGARRFARPVTEEQGAAIAGALADEMDEGTEARARAAAAQGDTIACAPGCSACCEVMVMVYRPEAARVARWLLADENRGARERFRAAYPGWRDAAGSAPVELGARFAAGDQRGYDRLRLEQFRRRLMCAFNHEGRCTIYPVRPLGCRNAHAVGSSARCAADSPEPPVALAFVPLERLLDGANRLLRAAHNATPGAARHRPQALCAAVFDLL
jgi:Fe-S-cluster containining protein